MMNFTNDELNLMCIYSAVGSRTDLVEKLMEMKHYLENDETEMLTLTEAALEKLSKMSYEDFEKLEPYPNFDV